jgi:hypothetical protein
MGGYKCRDHLSHTGSWQSETAAFFGQVGQYMYLEATIGAKGFTKRMLYSCLYKHIYKYRENRTNRRNTRKNHRKTSTVQVSKKRRNVQSINRIIYSQQLTAAASKLFGEALFDKNIGTN